MLIASINFPISPCMTLILLSRVSSPLPRCPPSVVSQASGGGGGAAQSAKIQQQAMLASFKGESESRVAGSGSETAKTPR